MKRTNNISKKSKTEINRPKISSQLIKRAIIIALISLVYLSLVFLLVKSGKKEPTSNIAPGSEIKNILSLTDVNQQKPYYKALLERVGPVEAQELLMKSGLPFTGDGHLLNHYAGTFIYETEGLKGITLCRDYFLGSCYHGLLLSALTGDAVKDEDKIKEVVGHCIEKGLITQTQCMHGIGHAYLTAVGYKNLPVALEQCDILEKKVDGFMAWNCHDGIFMENMWALHSGVQSPDRWVKEGDDAFPCNYEGLKPEHIVPCWNNQGSLLYQRYGEIGKIGPACLKAPSKDAIRMCYDGLARQILSLSNAEPSKIIQLCSQTTHDWIGYCLITNVFTAYGNGDRVMPYKLCKLVDESVKPSCYNRLAEAIKPFRDTKQEREEACRLIDEQNQIYTDNCLSRII